MFVKLFNLSSTVVYGFFFFEWNCLNRNPNCRHQKILTTLHHYIGAIQRRTRKNTCRWKGSWRSFRQEKTKKNHLCIHHMNVNENVTDCKLFFIALKRDEVSRNELCHYCLLTECGEALKWLHRLYYEVKRLLNEDVLICSMHVGRKEYFSHFKSKYYECQ